MTYLNSRCYLIKTDFLKNYLFLLRDQVIVIAKGQPKFVKKACQSHISSSINRINVYLTSSNTNLNRLQRISPQRVILFYFCLQLSVQPFLKQVWQLIPHGKPMYVAFTNFDLHWFCTGTQSLSRPMAKEVKQSRQQNATNPNFAITLFPVAHAIYNETCWLFVKELHICLLSFWGSFQKN